MGLTEHHHIAVSRGGSNNHTNKKPIDERRHSAIHTLFGNATPVEQIRETIKMNLSVLKSDFAQQILELLECESPYVCSAVKDKEKLETSEYQTGLSRYPRLYTESLSE